MSGGAKFGLLVIVVLLLGVGGTLFLKKDELLNSSVGPDTGNSTDVASVSDDVDVGVAEVPEPAADEVPVEEEPGVYAQEQKAYLVENAKQDGIVVTESGLQFRILSESGKSDKPSATDTVQVHYRGRLTDGIEFDSSYNYGEPLEPTLNEVIDGWTEGVQLMSIGDVYEFTIPPNLGYGAAGDGDEIPGHSVLIFEIELLDIIRP